MGAVTLAAPVRPEPAPPIALSTVCIGCHRFFKSQQALAGHLRMSRECQAANEARRSTPWPWPAAPAPAPLAPAPLAPGPMNPVPVPLAPAPPGAGNQAVAPAPQIQWMGAALGELQQRVARVEGLALTPMPAPVPKDEPKCGPWCWFKRQDLPTQLVVGLVAASFVLVALKLLAPDPEDRKALGKQVRTAGVGYVLKKVLS